MPFVVLKVWYNKNMKNRDYKKFSKLSIHHIYNRGVGKMKIFRNSQDYNVFMLRLKEYLLPDRVDWSKLSHREKRRKPLPPNSFSLISYCLMPNHFHLLIQQLTDLPTSKLISKLCTTYSIYFNKKYDRVGALFQDQFKAVLIENNDQLLWTSVYIHKNPLEAELVEELDDYNWNSYGEYSENGIHSLCVKNIITDQYHSIHEYLDLVKSTNNNDINLKLPELMLDNE